MNISDQEMQELRRMHYEEALAAVSLILDAHTHFSWDDRRAICNLLRAQLLPHPESLQEQIVQCASEYGCTFSADGGERFATALIALVERNQK